MPKKLRQSDRRQAYNLNHPGIRAGVERRKKQRRAAKAAILKPTLNTDPQPQRTTARQF